MGKALFNRGGCFGGDGGFAGGFGHAVDFATGRGAVKKTDKASFGKSRREGLVSICLVHIGFYKRFPLSF